jgi:hypothetical protein
MDIANTLRNYYGKYRLTVSGDISIAAMQPGRIYDLAGAERQLLQQEVAELCHRYPCLQVEIKDGISDAAVSFFAYDGRLDDADFLEHLQQWLNRVAAVLMEQDDVRVTINFSGIFYCQRQEEHFRYLNKGREVQYKLTTVKELGLYEYITKSRTLRIAVTVIAVLVLCWFLYSNVVPQEESPAKLV